MALLGKKKSKEEREAVKAQKQELKPDRTIANLGKENKGPAPRELDFLHQGEDNLDENIVEKHAPSDRKENGPFDISEVERNDNEVDCGSIILPEMPNLDVRMEMEENTGRILSLNFDDDDSSLQVQAFAAPKSEGLWLALKDQIAESAIEQGGTVQPIEGKFGHELVVSIPDTTQANAVRAARFVGVDGPRWFLRGVFSGPAAVDEEKSKELEKAFRAVAVNRGENPLPPKDLLELKIPQGALENPQGTTEQTDQEQTTDPRLRGPEIRQVGG
ncbi:MAG: DUF3710 domain-containing protein [Micrococcaceae bacterium]